MLLPSAASHAAESEWIKTDFAKLRLISASETAGQTNNVMAALDIWLEDGWKTYWRTPGDAGLAPQIFVTQPSTIGLEADISYPVPARFELFGIDTFGYANRVILPVSLEWQGQGDGLMLSAMFETLICSDNCVPVSGGLSLTLPAGSARPSIYAQDIARALANVPREKDANFTLSLSDKEKGDLVLQFNKQLMVQDIFIEGVEGASFGVPITQDNQRYLIPHKGGSKYASIGDELTITIDAGAEFYESKIKVSDNGAYAENPNKTASSLPIWLIAFLGGLILNLMPCVLPVLSIKISSIMQMAGATALTIRKRFIASAAGIIASFALIALFLQILRQAGHQIGWGIQFQSPVFLGVMAVVMALFTLSLFDLVHFRVPAFVNHLLPSSTAKPAGKKETFVSDFAAGMLATLLATPCSAPFVGTAVSFGLSQSDGVLYATLLMMGLGLASPWLLGALFPSFISILPRPGAWMVKLKYGLGILMLGTFIWIMSLFVHAAGIIQSAAISSSADYQSFDEGALARLIDDDQIVFVDVTADWCITCKANKALVLDTKATHDLFDEANAKMMQADWTLPDERISAFLARYERFGIPFNIIYGPNARDGIILPEILSFDALEKAVNAANQ